ncbi:caspase-7-like isoform X2 [Dreissena polymorpha]|nr:caspase-7-like isoform X2 [Dreissena polymorpha]
MIIINNEHFKSHGPRPGTDVDVENLKSTFTDLGFDMQIHHNKTYKEMMKIFKSAAKRDHSQSDCFACIVLSHGDEVRMIDKHRPDQLERLDVIYATDGIMFTKDIIQQFSDLKVPSLANKPRLFFVQACRGSSLDSGVPLPVGDLDMPDGEMPRVEVSPCPLYKDSLIMYATPPGYYAFRRPDTGSWFVRALCKVFSDQSPRKRSLNQLLTAVIKLVAQEYESQSANWNISKKKQTPCFQSMLTKDIYFKGN